MLWLNKALHFNQLPNQSEHLGKICQSIVIVLPVSTADKEHLKEVDFFKLCCKTKPHVAIRNS